MVERRAQVLVVEDEPDIAQLIKHTLERQALADVSIASTGEAGLAHVRERPPDLMILDLNLPFIDGIDVCRAVKTRPNTDVPIIIVTARSSEADHVMALDLGADDYVTKPFSVRELAARVRAVLRRARARPDAPESAPYAGRLLHIDFDAIQVTVGGAPVRLTRREFELLRCLVDNRNRVLSRDRLLERVWGYSASLETRTVDVHVGRLRAKLAHAGDQIETVVGLGYRFVEPSD